MLVPCRIIVSVPLGPRLWLLMPLSIGLVLPLGSHGSDLVPCSVIDLVPFRSAHMARMPLYISGHIPLRSGGKLLVPLIILLIIPTWLSARVIVPLSVFGTGPLGCRPGQLVPGSVVIRVPLGFGLGTLMPLLVVRVTPGRQLWVLSVVCTILRGIPRGLLARVLVPGLVRGWVPLGLGWRVPLLGVNGDHRLRMGLSLLWLMLSYILPLNWRIPLLIPIMVRHFISLLDRRPILIDCLPIRRLRIVDRLGRPCHSSIMPIRGSFVRLSLWSWRLALPGGLWLLA